MSFLPNQSLVGQIISIAALTLAPLTTFFGRHYSRTLYFAQILYILSMFSKSSTQASFSTNLDYTWLSFMPSFTTKYCVQYDFSCLYGNLISPGIIWVGGAVVLLILIKILACNFKSLRFLRIYSFYRGFSFWFIGPLVYNSTDMVRINDQKDYSFISAIIVLAVFFLIALIELIAAKRSQSQQSNAWRKWINFMFHIQIWTIMIIFAINFGFFSFSYLESSDFYFRTDNLLFINIPLSIYFLFFIVKYNFLFNVVERIFVFIQDGIIIAISNIYIIDDDVITQQNLDFYAITVVGCIELAFLIPKMVNFFKNIDEKEEENLSIHPENDIIHQSTVNTVKKHYPWPQFLNESIQRFRQTNTYAFPNSPLKSPVPTLQRE